MAGRLAETVLLHLLGVDHLDDELDGVLTRLPVSAGHPTYPTHDGPARRIAAAWSSRDRLGTTPAVLIVGDPDEHATVFVAACRSCGLQPHELRATVLPDRPRDLALLLRLCEREALLRDVAVRRRLVVTVTVDLPDPGTRRTHWAEALAAVAEAGAGAAGTEVNGTAANGAWDGAVRRFAGHFVLGPTAVRGGHRRGPDLVADGAGRLGGGPAVGGDPGTDPGAGGWPGRAGADDGRLG